MGQRLRAAARSSQWRDVVSGGIVEYVHSSRRRHPMTPHPILDLAAQFARIVVVGMSVTAVVGALVLLAVALL